MPSNNVLFRPLELPCGVVLKNRIVKSAMSDSLGDGTGHPTQAQNRLYQRWAQGGVAVSIIGEVQSTPHAPEKPGNLVLDPAADLSKFRALAVQGSENDAHLWLQLGHAGALSYAPISRPKGPSALDLPGLRCSEMTLPEIEQVPLDFARTAKLAQQAGFGGVQIHAAHGFLLSQFLSPLFNTRSDGYGGSIANRMKLLLASIAATRAAVGPHFAIAVKLNASDQLAGGLVEEDALQVVAALETSGADLIDISGGTYFPGAKPASDSAGRGPYFLEFTARARTVTTKPLMLTGGFKTRAQAHEALESGVVDMIGLARSMVLAPDLPDLWRAGRMLAPEFPRFREAPEGGITAWYTMRLTDIGVDSEGGADRSLAQAIAEYDDRDRLRTKLWLQHFGTGIQ